jgi:hypothetical protein
MEIEGDIGIGLLTSLSLEEERGERARGEIDEVPKLGFLSAARKELRGEAGEARGEVGARKGRGERRWRSARWGEAGHAKCVDFLLQELFRESVRAKIFSQTV